MGNLIRVDDENVRRRAFERVEKLLQKLQRMEKHVESFYERDQRLFQSWYDLTFREQRQAVAGLRTQYRDLADFHNQMLALAKLEDLSLHEAAVRLREEEHEYPSASEGRRLEIEADRRVREEYIRSQSEREERRRRVSAETEADESRAYRPPDDEDIEEIAIISELGDEELEEWCASSEAAFMMMGTSLRVASVSKDFSLFFRLWDVTHPKIQNDFARQFKKDQGYSLHEAIENMRTQLGGDDVDDGEARPGDGERVESMKLLYRQLARKLHPDMHGKDPEAHGWRKKMWLRVQEVYRKRDTKELEKLFHLACLRGRELNDLRLSDLERSHQWLSDELAELTESVENLKRKPAWGFAGLKDFSPVKSKLEREMRSVRDELERKVTELRTHHAVLERMGRQVQRSR